MSKDREEQRQKAEELTRVIKLALPEGQWDLVRQLRMIEEDLAHDGRDDEVNHLVDGIARHFPGLEPAIRAVASHFTEANRNLEVDECGLGRKPAPDYLVAGCAPGAEPQAADAGAERDGEAGDDAPAAA